jgi:hypothetical protein
MRAFILSRRKTTIVTALAVILMVISVVTVKLSFHPILSLIGTIALIPVFAAIVGAIPDGHHNDPSYPWVSSNAQSCARTNEPCKTGNFPSSRASPRREIDA